MQYEIKNDKLVKILEERQVIIDEIDAMNKEQFRIEDEKKKLGYKLNRLKEKTDVIIQKENIKLEEFDFIGDVYLKDGKAMYRIENILEAWFKPKEQVAKEIILQAKEGKGIFADRTILKRMNIPDGDK